MLVMQNAVNSNTKRLRGCILICWPTSLLAAPTVVEMSSSQAKKASQGISWQFLVIIGAFSVVVFFSFFAVAYVTPLHTVGGAAVLLQSTTESVQKTALDLLTGSKPQLRTEDHVLAESKSKDVAAAEVPLNPTQCKSVEIIVNSTIGTGTVVLAVHHDWAPLGAARFCELVNAKYYDEVKFFRVLKVNMPV